MLGKSIYEIFHIEDLQKLSNAHAQIKSTKFEQVSIEHQIRKKVLTFF